MRQSVHYLSLATAVSAAALVAACSGGGGGGSTGTLGVSMTDAPACGYDAINVTVQKVSVMKSGATGDSEGDWIDIPLKDGRPIRVNLLDLTNGILQELGEAPLAEGRYTQMRLLLDPNTGANSLANSIVLTGDVVKEEIHLDTPSAVQSGIKLIKPFEVKAGERVDLVLDFDACKSIVTAGNNPASDRKKYLLKPVIEVLPKLVSGIDGYIDRELVASNVAISAQQNGVIVRSTVPKDSGEFVLAYMAPGVYDVVMTADGRATAVVASVEVTEGKTVNLSGTGLPITLPASAVSESISGTATVTDRETSTEVVSVAAQQTFSSGPKVTVKYHGADVSDNMYAITDLPTAEPQLAKYSDVRPLTFTTQSTTTPGTGKYSVQATATGYQDSAAQVVDLNTGAKTGINFELLPK